MDYSFHPDSSFPAQIDLQSVIQYIVPIPNINSLIPSAIQADTRNFKLAHTYLLKKQKQLELFTIRTEDMIEQAKHILNFPIPIQEDTKSHFFDFRSKKKPEKEFHDIADILTNLHNQKHYIHPSKVEEIRKLSVLKKKYHKITLKVIESRQKLSIDLQKRIDNFLLLCDYFMENPQPVLLDIRKAIPNENILVFSSQRELLSRFQKLRFAVHSKTDFLNVFPSNIFSGTVVQYQNFLKEAIDLAIRQRKVETSYFESLPCENLMFSFFESPISPIYDQIKVIQTLKSTSQEEDVTGMIIEWISNSANIVLNYVYNPKSDSVNDKEIRVETISIFLVRFVFDFTFPWLDRAIQPDPQFTKKLEEISKKTPREMKFSLSFVKPELVDRPCIEIYSNGSVAHAPVEYLFAAQYETCPLRVAYCINKAHESVSVMAALQAAQNSELSHSISETVIDAQSETSDIKEKAKSSEILIANPDGHNDTKNFFSKLPGFDDIFEFWVSLLCAANIADVRGLNHFLQKWKRLPGFSSRFRASCTYLEAAIAQIESYDEEEDHSA